MKLCDLGNFKVKVVDLYCYECFRLFPDLNTFNFHPHGSIINQISDKDSRSKSYHVDDDEEEETGGESDEDDEEKEQQKVKYNEDEDESDDDCIVIKEKNTYSSRNKLKRRRKTQASAVKKKLLKRSNSSSSNLKINLRRCSTNNNSNNNNSEKRPSTIANTSKKEDFTKSDVIVKPNPCNSRNAHTQTSSHTTANSKELKDYLHCMTCIEGGKMTMFNKLPELIQHIKSCKVEKNSEFLDYLKKNPGQVLKIQDEEEQVEFLKEKSRVQELDKCNKELTEEILKLQEQNKQLNRLLNQQDLAIQHQKALLQRYRQEELARQDKEKELEEIQERKLKELKEKEQLEKLEEKKQRDKSMTKAQETNEQINDQVTCSENVYDSIGPQNDHDDDSYNLDSSPLPFSDQQESSEGHENLDSNITSALDSSTKENGSIPRKKTTTKVSNGALKPKTHICKVCDRGFRHFHLLRSHYRIHLEKKYKCQFCSFSTVRRDALVNHLLQHPGEESYKCVEGGCEESFSCVGELHEHSRTHNATHKTPSSESGNSEKPFKCNQCDKSFFKKNSLELHRVRHNGGATKPWKCTECDASFNRRYALKCHEVTHQPDAQPLVCPVCQKTFITAGALQHHSYTHKEARFQCNVCGIKIKNKHSFRRHMSIHAADREKFICETCGQSFTLQKSLQNHVDVVHKKIKNHLCSFCGKAFATNHRLEDHKRMHTGETPFECDVCGLKCRSLSILRHHKLTHTTEKRLECKVCQRRFKRSCVLSRHLRTHTQAKPYVCKFCDARFRDNRVLKKHVVYEHGDDDVEFDLDNPLSYQGPKGGINENIAD